eukprot:821539_1
MPECNIPRKRQRGNELGGIWPRLLTVGAFAWALYLRRGQYSRIGYIVAHTLSLDVGGANPAQTSSTHENESRTDQNLPKSTKSSSRPVLQPEAAAEPEIPNTDLTD